MMEFMLLTLRACKRGDWETVETCLRLADELLRLGDSKIKNAVYVSYLESLPRKGEVHDRLRKMVFVYRVGPLHSRCLASESNG